MRIYTRMALSFALLAMVATTGQAELIGHWTFDEATSGAGTGTAEDSSGKDYDGTLNGGTTYTAGRIGSGALQFNGTTGYVEVPHQADLSLAATDFTIAYWSRWDGMLENPPYPYQLALSMEWGMSLEGGWYVAYSDKVAESTSIVYEQLDGTEGGAAWAIPTDDYDLVADIGNWRHLAMVFDDAGDIRKFYVDGVLAASVETTTGLADRGVDPLVFGAYAVNYPATSWRGFYNGALDDIQIYDQALTPSQVATVAAGGVIPEPSTFVMLIAGLLGLLACNRRRK